LPHNVTTLPEELEGSPLGGSPDDDESTSVGGSPDDDEGSPPESLEQAKKVKVMAKIAANEKKWLVFIVNSYC